MEIKEIRWWKSFISSRPISFFIANTHHHSTAHIRRHRWSKAFFFSFVFAPIETIQTIVKLELLIGRRPSSCSLSLSFWRTFFLYRVFSIFQPPREVFYIWMGDGAQLRTMVLDDSSAWIRLISKWRSIPLRSEAAVVATAFIRIFFSFPLFYAQTLVVRNFPRWKCISPKIFFFLLEGKISIVFHPLVTYLFRMIIFLSSFISSLISCSSTSINFTRDLQFRVLR